MKIGGEFILTDEDGNEHVFPNQFTIAGMEQVVNAAFRSTLLNWFIGLCAHNPGDNIALVNVQEPSGLNGYARKAMPGDATHWPTIAQINGETYVESQAFTFIATGPYDIATNRLFVTDGTSVIAISSPVPQGLGYQSVNYTTKYRLYFR
jgi:hypothetical protein